MDGRLKGCTLYCAQTRAPYIGPLQFAKNSVSHTKVPPAIHLDAEALSHTSRAKIYLDLMII
jgi:hypothetical protein